MGLDLTLGFDNESQTHGIAESPCNGPHCERPRVPDWVQERWPVFQFREALPSPRQMVGFFLARLFKMAPQLRIAAHQCLRCVERLGADFTDMIHPHKCGCFLALGLSQRRVWCRPDGARSSRTMRSKKCSQGTVSCEDERFHAGSVRADAPAAQPPKISSKEFINAPKNSHSSRRHYTEQCTTVVRVQRAEKSGLVFFAWLMHVWLNSGSFRKWRLADRLVILIGDWTRPPSQPWRIFK